MAAITGQMPMGVTIPQGTENNVSKHTSMEVSTTAAPADFVNFSHPPTGRSNNQASPIAFMASLAGYKLPKPQ